MLEVGDKLEINGAPDLTSNSGSDSENDSDSDITSDSDSEHDITSDSENEIALESEVWKVVEEVPQYEVSTLGRVRRGMRLLDSAPSKTDGYIRVALCLGVQAKSVRRYVHTLVAKAFLDNPFDLPVVNHKNWQKSDNTVGNLEWVSFKENREKWTPGALPGKRGRKVAQMSLIGECLQIWESAIAAARSLPGRQHANIVACCRKRRVTAGGFQWLYIDDIDPPLDGEEWAPIIVKGKHWEASTIGRIRTDTGYTTYGAKGGPYLTVNRLCVHVLVARAFCKKLENDRVVNHIDGNKQNNKSSNLEWCTHSHNSQHAVDTGLTPKDRSSKLKKAVLQILPDGTTCEFDSLASAERATGIARASIRTVCRGEHIKAECAGGFGWEYIETHPPTIEDAQRVAATDLKSAPCGSGSVIQTLPNGIARRFASVFDAARETGIPHDEIEEACRGEGTTTGWAHVTIVFDDDPIWAILEAELQG